MTPYIALYKGLKTTTDKVISTALSVRHRTITKYSHVELLVERPYFVDLASYTLAQTTIAASKRDGKQVRCKEPLIFKPGNWDFVSLPISKDRYGLSLDIWEEASTRVGIRYDTLGAVLCVTPFARLKLDAEWCSAMIADICDWDEPEKYDPYMVGQKALQIGGEFFKR